MFRRGGKRELGSHPLCRIKKEKNTKKAKAYLLADLYLLKSMVLISKFYKLGAYKHVEEKMYKANIQFID